MSGKSRPTAITPLMTIKVAASARPCVRVLNTVCGGSAVAASSANALMIH